jgi:hypothetical protein
MANFPRPEAEIKALAQSIINGLSGDGNTYFPNPPVMPADLQALLDTFVSSDNAQVVAQAEAQQATETKHAALEELTIAMRSVLRYAENTVQGNSAKLATLGWSGKAEPSPLETPGQPRLLEAPKQGQGWLRLDWKAPAEGGVPTFYRIERRKLPSGSWEVAGTSLATEATLNNQERGKEWEYRVVAINKAGEGEPSNTTAAVL